MSMIKAFVLVIYFTHVQYASENSSASQPHVYAALVLLIPFTSYNFTILTIL